MARFVRDVVGSQIANGGDKQRLLALLGLK
jgi:hypothetical protein